MFSEKTKVSRRDILKGMAASSVAALGAASVMSGCSSSSDDPIYYYPTQPEPDTTPETIVPGSAYHNCKGRCVNNAHVKNGVIKRMSTDEREDTSNNPQLRSCLRCRAYKNKIYSPGRLLYPLLYAPDEPNAKRGDLSKFKRVSWDDAANYIKKRYDELKAAYPNMMTMRATQTGMYGRFQNRSFFEKVLNTKMGGFKGIWGSGPSFHDGAYTYEIVSADSMSGIEYSPDNLLEAKTIFLWGSNCVHSTGSTGYSWWVTKAKEKGAKLIYIGPVYNKTAEMADEFVPIKPGTDTALLLGMMHEMITQNYVMPENFIRAFTVGFYDDSTGSKTPQLSGKTSTAVPAGESLSAYILGKDVQGAFNEGKFSLSMNSSSTKYAYKQDFTAAKTPAWAAQICGISEAKIKELAKIFADTGKPCAVRSSIGMQRQPNGVQNCWLLLAMCLISGNWGMDGTGLTLHYYTALPGTTSLAGTLGGGAAPSTGTNPDLNAAGKNIIVSESLWVDAIRAQGDPARNAKWKFDAEIAAINRPAKIVYNYAGNSMINQHQDTFANMELFEDRSKVGLIITVDNHMTPTARWSDVILPGDTHYEREDIVADQNYILYQGKAIKPVGEIKANDEIAYAIGKAFGLEKWDINSDGKSYAKRIEDSWNTVSRNMTFDEFKKVGVYQEKKVGVAQKNSNIRVAGKATDAANIGTATGYFELYSNAMVYKYVNRNQTGLVYTHANLDDEGDAEVLPIPFWVDYQSSYADLYAGKYDGNGSIDSKEYPFMVLGQHSLWRVHSNHNGMAYLRELYKKDKDGNTIYDNASYSAPDWKNERDTGILSPYGIAYESIWMSPKNLQDLNLHNGQLVKVTSAQTRRSVIVSVYETPRCLPGVMVLEQGSWFDPVKLKDGSMVDRGGCASTLLSEMPTRNARGNCMMLCQVKIEPFDESQYA